MGEDYDSVPQAAELLWNERPNLHPGGVTTAPPLLALDPRGRRQHGRGVMKPLERAIRDYASAAASPKDRRLFRGPCESNGARVLGLG